MEIENRVLIFSDSETFGGHEKLLVSAIQYIIQKPDLNIFVVYHPENELLLNSLTTGGRSTSKNLHLIPVKLQRNLIGSLKHFSSTELHDVFRAIKPDIAISVQGSLHQSSAGIYTAKILKIPCVSYIPFSHTTKERHGRSSFLRKCKEKLVIRLVDHWITISQQSMNHLKQLGASGDCFIVKNGIETKSLKTIKKRDAKQKLNLPENTKTITVIGRTVDSHKGQIFLVNSILKWLPPKWLDKIHLVFVGDGPDRHSLIEKLKNSALNHHFSWFPWTQETNLFYHASDLIVLPSRFEGVPLVMLEAMFCKIPVVASDCGAICEFLPNECLFETNNSQKCVEAIIHNLTVYNSTLIENNHQLVSKEYTLQNFEHNFELVVRKIIKSHSKFDADAAFSKT